ncbi:hypothetical protein AAIB33_02185 [Microbacterium sp. AZCO]|uniref:hypothetical protein n=1 Tax=Microbacterium sp. AZCO TaxID=3142976 RepID=UPI0031F3A999
MFVIRDRIPVYINPITDPDVSGSNRAERRAAARYRRLGETAKHFAVSERTVENWHERGYITAFRGADNRLYYSIEEIELALAARPRSEMRDGRRRGKHGRIVPLPVEAAQ